MAFTALTAEQARSTLEALARFKSCAEAARELGVSDSTFRCRVQRARQIITDEPAPAKPFEIDDLPSELPTADELLARRKTQFGKKSAAKDARKLVPVRVKLDGPIGIMHMGDPHVDDDGTDIALLEKHVAIANKTEGLFAANVGDYSNNWVGRLARLYGQQSLSAAEAWVLVEWLIGSTDWLYLIGGNHDCLDMDTDALTRRGWVAYDDLRHDDEVLGIDRETGRGVWQPILQRVDRENNEEMVAIDGAVSVRVTPNHRMLHDRRNWRQQWRGRWEFATADSLPPRFRLPVAACVQNDGVDLSDEQIELAGWVLTDGSIQTGPGLRASIWQSKESPRIPELLTACGLAFKEIIRERAISQVCGRDLVKPPRPQREYRLNAANTRKLLTWVPAKGALPAWAWDLSDRQFRVLLDGLIAGDGCWDGKYPDRKTVAVLHGERAFLESVQAIAVQHGWRATLTVAREKDYRLNLFDRDTAEFERGKSVYRSAPSPRVWCLTVPHGNFMVRREGKPWVTGNCWSGAGDPIKWMAKQARAQYEANGMRLGLTFPNGRVIRINARHDFSGHSQFNVAHGPSKAAQMGWRDHVLVCGHLHTSGYNIVRDPSSGLLSHALRVGSYKVFDKYAEERGLPNQTFTVAPVTVIDPEQPDDSPRCVTVILDPEEGADYLTWKRKKWAKKRA